ncbi:MAG: Holliday junction resolvase RecU [Myxococcota bacterium]
MTRQRSRHSRLGMWWERFLSPLHARYALEQRAFINKTYPSFNVLSQKGAFINGVFSGEALPDYIGMANDYAWFAEAKETKGTRWNYDKLRGQQAEQLDRALMHGHGAFLLIRETDRSLGHLVPWSRLRERWWAWETFCQTHPGGRAPSGSASIAFSYLEDRISVFVDRTVPGRFDYLHSLVEWMAVEAEDRPTIYAQKARRRNQRGRG